MTSERHRMLDSVVSLLAAFLLGVIAIAVLFGLSPGYHAGQQCLVAAELRDAMAAHPTDTLPHYYCGNHECIIIPGGGYD
jgi:hypothetical protein